VDSLHNDPVWPQTCHLRLPRNFIALTYGEPPHPSCKYVGSAPTPASAFRSIGSATQLEATSYIALTQYWDFPILLIFLILIISRYHGATCVEILKLTVEFVLNFVANIATWNRVELPQTFTVRSRRFSGATFVETERGTSLT
jgi:hypothetical protein